MTLWAFVLLWPAWQQQPALADAYTHPTVTRPVPDGVGLHVPSFLGNADLARLGYVDVTAPPYSADPTGMSDSTEALQRAIDTARDQQMVCFLPPGKYLVSDTLHCIQGLYRRTNGEVYAARLFPVALMGSRQGKRPRIVLAPNSPGFNDPAAPKPVVHFWARKPDNPQEPQPDISFNQVFCNIDIVVEQGNAGAVGIDHNAAQGSAVEECVIDVRPGYAGVVGGIGAGGGMTDVTVLGGRIGLDLRKCSNAVPTLTGLRLFGQTQAAILHYGLQSLTAVGMEIEYPGEKAAIRGPRNLDRPFHGQINLVDCLLDLTHPQAVGVASDASIYLRRCFFRGGGRAVEGPQRANVPSARDWVRIGEFAAGQGRIQHKGFSYEAPVYLGTRRAEEPVIQSDQSPPPPDLRTRHLWRGPWPGFETKDAAIATALPFEAQGDGRHDDTDALQMALDTHDVVFLPKGYYLISRPLRLKPGNRLIGAASHLSVIMATPGSWKQQELSPLVETPDSATADVTMAFLTLYAPKLTPFLYALRWSSGGDSVLRGVHARVLPPLGGFRTGNDAQWDHPLVLADGHAGGKWYRFNEGNTTKQGKGYRHLLLKRAHRLSIYHLNPEHAVSDAQVELTACNGVDIYGVKSEGNAPVLLIDNSRAVSMYGYGGKSAAHANQALFVIRNSRDIRLTNLMEAPALGGADLAGTGRPPTTWSMVQVEAGKDTWRTRPLDRPVLFLLAGQATP